MKDFVRRLYGAMPREFANPQRRPVRSFERLLELVDQHNGVTDVYASVCPFDGEEMTYDNVLVNKALFDFDGAWDELVATHEWLAERDVAHLVVFSGSDRSGHVYVLVKPTTHQQSLEYFQRDVVIEGVGLRKCGECGSPVERADTTSKVAPWRCGACDQRRNEESTRLPVDTNLVGNPAAMVRIPNTYHPRAERFCVPLRPEEVTKDVESVYELAESQRDLEFGEVVCGTKTPPIDQKAETAEQKYRTYQERQNVAGLGDARSMEDFEAEVPPDEVMRDIDCECVRGLITDGADKRTMPPLGHRERRTLISYLVEKGYNPAEIAEFLRWAIDDQKARHSIHEEKQPIRLWRDGVRAPNKVTLKQRGHFSQRCPEHTRVATGVDA